MGLDITAYRKIEIANGAAVDEDGDPVDYDEHQRFYFNPDFQGREEGLVEGAIYTRGTEEHDFRAGGYGGYNAWREELAKLAGYPATPHTRYLVTEDRHDAGAWEATEGPFWELINFSDCEGVIGPVVSAKLAKDFEEFDERAKVIGDYFYDRYLDWKLAFELAADGGAVVFH